MKKLILLTFILFPHSIIVNAQDVIILKNGDELHGEIKSLNKSVLTIETDYSDKDFAIEWKDVVQINSQRSFNIFLSSREKLYATIHAAEQKGYVTISNEDFPEREISLAEIVIINPIKDKFSDRYKASISAGLTLTKANDSKQFSLRATSSYMAKNWQLSGNFNQVISVQNETEPVRRTDASVNFVYLFYKNWFGSLHGDFLSNTEQQIDLRSTQTVAVGNLLIRNNKLYLSGSAGITLNREDYSNETTILNTKEVFLGGEFNAYDIGDLSFLTKVNYYRSITESDRNRVNLNLDAKYEFPYDLFIKVGYTLNFDSKPPNEGSRDDYVFQTTFGWEF